MSSRPDSRSAAKVDAGAASVVYVVDDDESVRSSLSSLLRSVGLRVETFASAEEFCAFPRAAIPSCLILDVRLRGKSGLAFHEEIVKSGLPMPVLFITGYGDIEMSVKAMKAGAADFFAKPFREQDMLDAVSQALVRDGQRMAAEESVAELRQAYESLTAREKEVLGFVLSGMMNKQIAAFLNLSEITVKIHRAQAMKKMAARSVAELVRKADTLGIKPQVAK
jgi:FixJ family two-component response regulator